jgi:drug/metabolite transporter (DMT)-like permease
VVLASLLYAGSMILTRFLAGSESSGSMVLHTALVFAAGSAGFAAAGWVPFTRGGWVALVCIAAAAGAGHFCLAQAYRIAPVSAVAPFEYTALLWATIAGWVIWGDLPAAGVLAGSVLVIGAGLYVLHREARA